jgi:uncharacterized protein YceK
MRIVLRIVVLCFLSGCTTVALKRVTLAHAQSATGLRYWEVMENLAIIASTKQILQM